MFQTTQEKVANDPVVLPALKEASNASIKINGVERPLVIMPRICLQHGDAVNLLAHIDRTGELDEQYRTIKNPLPIATVTIQSAENLSSREITYGVVPKKLPSGEQVFALVNTARPAHTLLHLTAEQINALSEDMAYVEDPQPWLKGLLSSKAVQMDMGKVSVDLIPGLGSTSERAALKEQAEFEFTKELGVTEDYCRERLKLNLTFSDLKVLTPYLQKKYPDENITESDVKSVLDSIGVMSRSIGESFHYGLFFDEGTTNSAIPKGLQRYTSTIIEVFNPITKDSKNEQYIIKASDEDRIHPSKSLHIEIADQRAYVFIRDSNYDAAKRIDLGPLHNDFKMSQFFARLSENVPAGSEAEKELRKYFQRIVPPLTIKQDNPVDVDSVNKALEGLTKSIPGYLFSERTESAFYSDMSDFVTRALGTLRLNPGARPDVLMTLKKFYSNFDVAKINPTIYMEVDPKFDKQTGRPPVAKKFEDAVIPSRRIGQDGGFQNDVDR